MAKSTAGLLDLLQLTVTDLTAGQLPPIDLIKLLISKVLGYAILAGASFVKVPQILNVARARSAEGLSRVSSELEVLGFLVHFSYGFVWNLPFNTYGEAALLLAQTLVLLLLVNKYSGAPSFVRTTLVFTLLGGGATAVYAGLVEKAAIATAYELNNIVFTSARVPQILANFKTKSTGQLSIITATMNMGGSVARIFTSIQEGGGSAMVRSYIIGATLNFVLFAQILFYGKNKGKTKAA